jgi:peroxiredoxin Q/BCP
MGSGKKLILVFGGLALSCWLLGLSGCGSQPAVTKPGGLQVGDRAADFALMDNRGKIIRLSDVQEGWYLVLVFYRGHWCGACLNQLLDMKKDFLKFSPLRVVMAAISVDPVEESAHFAAEWRFPFPLLSDNKFQLIDAYGLRHPKEHEGKDISHPAVVIIDPQKIVRYKYVGNSAADRPTNDEILFIIRQMEKKAVKP